MVIKRCVLCSAQRSLQYSKIQSKSLLHGVFTPVFCHFHFRVEKTRFSACDSCDSCRVAHTGFRYDSDQDKLANATGSLYDSCHPSQSLARGWRVQIWQLILNGGNFQPAHLDTWCKKSIGCAGASPKLSAVALLLSVATRCLPLSRHASRCASVLSTSARPARPV